MSDWEAGLTRVEIVIRGFSVRVVVLDSIC